MKERGNVKALNERRETQCRAWARNPEIIQCLKSIINWSEESSSSATKIDENVHDWVNNIVWYSNMQDFDPVFVRTKSLARRELERSAYKNG